MQFAAKKQSCHWYSGSLGTIWKNLVGAANLGGTDTSH